MGTYGVAKIDIVRKLAETLDDIEGDFTQETLEKALDLTKAYPYVSDKMGGEKAWRKLIDEY